MSEIVSSFPELSPSRRQVLEALLAQLDQATDAVEAENNDPHERRSSFADPEWTMLARQDTEIREILEGKRADDGRTTVELSVLNMHSTERVPAERSSVAKRVGDAVTGNAPATNAAADENLFLTTEHDDGTVDVRRHPRQ